ncbi:MAG: transcription antitermination factor NusB [Acidobacteria bacterium]|nr:transcription antitermination factor NusB [Acidobacteriota bacterium]MCB9397124.1 transcription antitermination factor NusB [Acidobacteriota bacterium]
MASRSRARQFAIQILYQIEFSGYDTERVFELFFEGQESDPKTADFAKDLVEGILDKAPQLDLEINEYLRGWTLERISRLDHLVLRLAVYELMEQPNLPWKVIVDEAVNLAQMFSGQSSASFVNGLLHAWCEANRSGEKES